MSQTVKCPNCHQPVEISQALRSQIEEEVLVQERAAFDREIRSMREAEEQQRKVMQMKMREEQEREERQMREELNKQYKLEVERAQLKVHQSVELEMKTRQEELAETRERNKQLQEQLTELTRTMRQLQERDHQRELEMEKQLWEAQEKIKQQARKQSDEDNHLVIEQLKKQISDAHRESEELRRKLQQGSQQTQGEVLELELEAILKNAFPMDIIKEVPKGIRGADVLQEVVNVRGQICGSILWESKNTKSFVQGWIPKLKDDQRAVKAEVAILVSTALPEGVTLFEWRDGVLLTSRECILALAGTVRQQLKDIAVIKRSTEGRKEKMEILYEYMSGIEFSQRVQAMIERLDALRVEQDREKKWFAQKWARQDKIIQSLSDQWLGMHGDVQGIVGGQMLALAEVEIQLEIEEMKLV